MKITILERINDYGNWEWYDIYTFSKMKPEEAIWELIENDGLEKQTVTLKGDGYYYAEIDDIRAMEYEI